MNGRIQSDIDSIETIKTPEKIKFLDLIPELKRKAAIDSNFDVSLWTVDQSGFPSQLISPEENVNNYFKSSSRIFVSQHKQDLNKIESKDDLRPFFVSFYDSDSDYPQPHIPSAISFYLALFRRITSFHASRISRIYFSASSIISISFCKLASNSLRAI